MSTAAWPTSVQTIAHMYVAVNELQNNLNGAITSGATTLSLNSSTNFPAYGTVLIDNEVILYTGISGNDLTGLTRGFDSPNSVAAAHANGAVVSFAIVADHHNILAAEINAIETSLNLTASQVVVTNASGRLTTQASPSLTELGYLAGVTSAIQTQINAKGSGTVTSVSGTANQISSTGGTTPVLSITNPFDPPGQIQGVVGSVGTPTYSFVGHTNTGLYELSDTLIVSANGTIAAQFTKSTGQVLLGTTTNDSATTGNIGEYIASVTSATAGTTTAWADVTSISLTAGDWDVTFDCLFSSNGNTITTAQCGISTTAGNSSAGLTFGDNLLENLPPTTIANTSATIANYRISLSATTTIYAKHKYSFSGTAPSTYARLSARRIR